MFTPCVTDTFFLHCTVSSSFSIVLFLFLIPSHCNRCLLRTFSLAMREVPLWHPALPAVQLLFILLLFTKTSCCVRTHPKRECGFSVLLLRYAARQCRLHYHLCCLFCGGSAPGCEAGCGAVEGVSCFMHCFSMCIAAIAGEALPLGGSGPYTVTAAWWF